MCEVCEVRDAARGDIGKRFFWKRPWWCCSLSLSLFAMKFQLSERVRAPAQDVFAVLTDVESAPSRIPAIIKVEVVERAGEPFGVGTRWRETRRIWYVREQQ